MNMSKTQIVYLSVIIIIAIAALSFLSLPQNAESNVKLVDFEQGSGSNFGDWIVDADLPDDPNNPGGKVQWHITHSVDISLSPNTSAEFFIDGSQDDGTIWQTKKLDLSPNVANLKISFWLYSETESFNTIVAVVAYAGTKRPTTESEFSILGEANAISGWKEYTFNAITTSIKSSETWVAIGISVRWETEMTYYIDDIRLETA